ncbi:hypothetical protein [Zooshikella sp. RANM57]|uniref:hypothetical protein n=1 Tax=Zooshikella sp. RANM57 TaxID=3425863 RepID=UPI003D6E6482
MKSINEKAFRELDAKEVELVAGGSGTSERVMEAYSTMKPNGGTTTDWRVKFRWD